MQRLQTAYTVWFNRKHRRAGHLTQGRYHADLVSGDEYLLRLRRYVHLNPVHLARLKNESLSAGEVMKVVCDEFGIGEGDLKRRTRGNAWRGVASQMLVRYAAYNQRDVGSYLKIGNGAAVSRQLQRLRQRLSAAKSLAVIVRRIDHQLHARAKEERSKC